MEDGGKTTNESAVDKFKRTRRKQNGVPFRR